VQTLHILAASPASARGLVDALRDFEVELRRTSDGGYEVRVQLEGDDRETIAVLNALERHVNERAARAHLTLNGREYVLDPEPAAQARRRAPPR
jgi:hypothetical protein